MVWRADDAFFFHLLNQARCSVIADLQTTLHIAGGRTPIVLYNRNRLIIVRITAFHSSSTCLFFLLGCPLPDLIGGCLAFY